MEPRGVHGLEKFVVADVNVEVVHGKSRRMAHDRVSDGPIHTRESHVRLERVSKVPQLKTVRPHALEDATPARSLGVFRERTRLADKYASRRTGNLPIALMLHVPEEIVALLPHGV
jgi:hypothetical protein